MPTPRELEQQFWDTLKSDRTMMLGLDGVEDGHARPMTAQFEQQRGPIWFFTAKDNAIVERLDKGNRAIATLPRRTTISLPPCTASFVSTTIGQ